MLLGHALVRDEHGEEMHKIEGQLDPLRRSRREDGRRRDALDVLPAQPGGEPQLRLRTGRRGGAGEFILKLWNTYAFFVAYARLDGWLPGETAGASVGRSLLDRWILSRLDAVTADVGAALNAYEAQRATRTIEAFVEDLSNWYVRRNRRRFWKGELDRDKAAAYATLYEVLAILTRLLAPFVPHVADAIWENLVAGVDQDAPDSVHLADFPSPPGGRRDEALEAAVDRTRRVVALGHAARSASGIRVRQPLPTVRIRLSGGGGLSDDPAIERELTEQVLDELNVKGLELIPDESMLIERSLRPLLPVLGPRRGSAVGSIMAAARAGDWRQLDDGRVEAGGEILEPDEFVLTARAGPGHEMAEEGDVLVALDTNLTPALEAEGLAREVGHRLQGLRKAAGYEISDRIAVSLAGDPAVIERLQAYRDWLAAELLADELTMAPDATLDGADRSEEVALGDSRLRIAVRRA